MGRSHFNHRLVIQVDSIADLQQKLTQYHNRQESSGLWQGKANTNKEAKLAVSIESSNPDLQELIESVVESSLVANAIANICWHIGDQKIIKNNERQTLIYTPVAQQKINWQILLHGLGQLYVSGIEIDWQTFGEIIGGKKICLPTYPFQRSKYWLH